MDCLTHIKCCYFPLPLQQMFNLKFDVVFRWVDFRLDIQNLWKSRFKNKLTDSEASRLWTPSLFLENAVTRSTVGYKRTTSSVITIEKNGSIKQALLSQLDEAQVYNANETLLHLHTRNSVKFHCKFDLKYFPFDQQSCNVQVKVEIMLINCLFGHKNEIIAGKG